MLVSPSWAPDGRSYVVSAGIAVGRPRVVIVQLAGGRRRTITGSAFNPAPYSVTFSPDGRYLLVPGLHRAYGLYAYDLRRGRTLQVLDGPVASGSAASWSPDGRRIALDREGGGIVVADLRARSVGVLTQDGGGAAWSPDGTRIAFATQRGVSARRCGEDGCLPTTDIDIVRSDGTGRRRLTHTAGDETSPSWSPDGKRLVAQLRGGTTYYEAQSGVVIVGPDGSCYRTLVPAAGRAVFELGPNAWRPNSGPAPREPGCH
jgi:TolB protein